MQVGFIGALQLLLIALKLCGVIAWGWAWVLSPTIAAFAIILVVFAFAVAFLPGDDYRDRRI